MVLSTNLYHHFQVSSTHLYMLHRAEGLYLHSLAAWALLFSQHSTGARNDKEVGWDGSHDSTDSLVPAPLRKSLPHSYADSSFIDSIALVKMPKKFSFPNMKLYDGTTNPTDHIASYKQCMFIAAIPWEQCEAWMCKFFGSSLQGPAL